MGDAIGEFYRNRRRDDLTLLYFTGHGLKDDQGRLYLAMTNTRHDDLLFTGLSAQQIDEAMESCSSRQKVLVLDCCYSGAFPTDCVSKAGGQVHTLEKFQGKGRVVLTASDATQYSFEGNRIIGEGTQSVFTRYLVEGLTTGEADLDSDGDISIDELYSYVHDRVIEEMPQQRPKKQENIEGRIVIARNIHWSIPAYVHNAIESPVARDRLAVLEGLAHLHHVGNDLVRTEVIHHTRRLIHDDSKTVSTAAMKLLTTLDPDMAQQETNEQARQEAKKQAQPEEQARRDVKKPRWVPAVSPGRRHSLVEEINKRQIATSPTMSLHVDRTTAKSDQLQREASADQDTQNCVSTEKTMFQQDAGKQARHKADNWTAPAWLFSWWSPLGRSPIPSDTGDASPLPPSVRTDGGRRWQVLIAIGALLALAGLIILAVFVTTNPTPSGSTLAPEPAPSAAPTAGPEVAIPALGVTIPVGKTPGFVVVSPNGRHAYITNRDAQLITVLDTAVDKVTATIPISAGPPQFLAFAPDGRTLYVHHLQRSADDTSDRRDRHRVEHRGRHDPPARTPIPPSDHPGW